MNVISEIEVKDLQNPIKLDIPLTQEVRESDGVPRCMFLNEQKNKWEELDSSCDVGPPKAGDTMISCCSTHLTTFTIQQLRYIEGPV